MRAIYTMAKQQMSTLTLTALTELQIINGCENLKPLLSISQSQCKQSDDQTATKCNGITYTHHDSIDEMYEVFSELIENNILEGLKTSTFYSLQINEGTDCSNLSTLMIYVRYLTDGKVHCKFISVNKLPVASADYIFGVLMQFLKNKKNGTSKLVGIASDGASVMQGVKNGVTTKLKSYWPFLVRTYCMAHSLALASEKACKQVPYMVKFIEVINRLGKLCKFSPKFCRALDSWIACLHTVQEDSAHGVTATGILKNVASYKFIATTYFCVDVIGILSILSKCMQKQGLLYSTIRPQVDSSIVAIQVLHDIDGPYFEEFKKLVAASPPTEFPMTTRFISHDISDSEKQRNEFLLVRKGLVKNIVKYMENWFPDSGIINIFCCLDPKSTRNPDQCEELLKHFGTMKNENDHKNAERSLLDPMIEKKAARAEYSVLEGIIKEHESLDIVDFYCQFIFQNDDAYPNLKVLPK